MSKVRKEPDETVKFSAMLKHDTEKAWLFVIGDDAYWFPKSQCEWAPSEDDDTVGSVTMPLWLAKKDGLTK